LKITRVHCDFEPGDFDQSEFHFSTDYGWVHLREPLHNNAGETWGESLPGALTYTLAAMRDSRGFESLPWVSQHAVQAALQPDNANPAG
jgi:hypothetical protein